MVDPKLLQRNFDTLVERLPFAFGDVVMHGDDGRPVAIILLIDDPEIASRFAALLPQLKARVGVMDT